MVYPSSAAVARRRDLQGAGIDMIVYPVASAAPVVSGRVILLPRKRSCWCSSRWAYRSLFDLWNKLLAPREYRDVGMSPMQIALRSRHGDRLRVQWGRASQGL